MAKRRHPNPIARRYLVERDMQPAQARQIAETYLEDDRVIDALPFLRKAGATDTLEALRGDAVAAGDAFLLRQIAAASGVGVAREEWTALAEAAGTAGKERYAVEARRQAAAAEE